MTSEVRRGARFCAEWGLAYLTRQNGKDAQCLVCKRHVLCKKYNVKRHYDVYHSEKFCTKTGEERKALLAHLKEECETAAVVNVSREELRRASYELSLQIVVGSHPFSGGEFVKNCITSAVKILSPYDLHKYESINLSRNTVARRADEMARNVEQQLKESCKEFVAFSLAADESSDVTDVAQLAVFIRGVNKEFTVTEELLDLIPLKNTTTGEDVFNAIRECVERMGLEWNKLSCVATDGAPAMSGRKDGLIGRLKKLMSEKGLPDSFVAVHCIVHQEALCATSVSMKHVMDIVVKCVNCVRAHGLNHRQFQEFLESIGSDHTDIPYFCEVRWLSRGKTLSRFFELREYISEFMIGMGKDTPQLSDPGWITDLAFYVDINQHLNELNLRLQGRDQLIYKMSDTIQAFKMKLSLWKSQLSQKNVSHFPTMQSLDYPPENIDFAEYAEILSSLLENFSARFEDFEGLQNKFALFATPFSVAVDSVPPKMQNELIDLICDTRMKAVYKDTSDVCDFYRTLDSNRYPNICACAANLMSMFGSTYTCEQFVSKMKLNKPRLRARLSDDHLRSIMRLVSARSLSPDLDQILDKETELSEDGD